MKTVAECRRILKKKYGVSKLTTYTECYAPKNSRAWFYFDDIDIGTWVAPTSREAANAALNWAEKHLRKVT